MINFNNISGFPIRVVRIREKGTGYCAGIKINPGEKETPDTVFTKANIPIQDRPNYEILWRFGHKR